MYVICGIKTKLHQNFLHDAPNDELAAIFLEQHTLLLLLHQRGSVYLRLILS